MNTETPWYSYSLQEVSDTLSSDFDRGLGSEEVSSRQRKYGKNIFYQEKKHSIVRKIFKQFKNPLVLILLVAGVITFILGEYLNMTVIFLALLINMSIDIFQEGRASSAFELLKKSQERHALVLRGGKKLKLLSEELVVGDIIFLEPGISIPADARLITDSSLLVNEASLTGEWIGVHKDAEEKVEKGPITEQVNMVWMGTLVSSGAGKAIVVETGNNTQLGRIAKSLSAERESLTPLVRNIRNLARFLAKMILILVSILVIIGLSSGETVANMLLVAVALAVAAIPEGLPAAVTVVLAFGMENILKKKGLVRNLLAAETLGSTTVILTDKTGTLTQAKMKVVSVVTALSLEQKDIRDRDTHLVLTNNDEEMVFRMAILASDAFVEWKEGEEGSFQVHGRPIEKAIVVGGFEVGLNQSTLLLEEPQRDLIPFSSDRKFSIAVHRTKDKETSVMIIVGAPEVILRKSEEVLWRDSSKKMSNTMEREFGEYQDYISSGGSRMVAVAYKKVSTKKIRLKELGKKDSTGNDFIFGGFIILDDPIREGVKEAIATAQSSGIKVIMLTGDHPQTAGRIAEVVGIYTKGNTIRIGTEIEAMSDTELLKELATTKVFARVLPHQKLRIAQLLQNEGEVVAMTGDGINDAPALRMADIGIALGSGTDVAKEASDLILLDNGFDVIVYAIEEGRRIVDNLKKITAYLLSTSFSEIILIGAALLVAAPLPLIPTQILWINIIGEGFMNFAFAFEPKEKGIMKRDPSSVGSVILTPSLKKLIFIIAAITGIFSVSLYFILTKIGLPIETIRTIMFVALSVSAIFFSFSLKNLHKPIWKIHIFSNKYLIGAFSISFMILILAVTLPALQTLLSLEPFSISIFGFIILFGILNLIIIESVKYFVFKEKYGTE